MNKTLAYKDNQIAHYVSGEGAPILFLHGWPTHSALWQAQADALESTNRVHRIDWLGQGNSDKPLKHHYSFTEKKRILDAIMPEILKEGEKITLVAHDIGGPPAILWASENEQKVDKLILLNTVLYPFKTALDATSGIILQIPVLKDVFVSQWGLKQVLATNTKSGHPKTKRRIKEILELYKGLPSSIKIKTLEDALENRKQSELADLSTKFQQLSIDRYLIIARKDPLCYAHIQKLSEENPEVPRFDLPRCGHFIPIDQPKELNEILKKILQASD